MKRPILIGALSLAHGELTAAGLSENGLNIILIILLAVILTWGIIKRRCLFLVLYVILFMTGYGIMDNTESSHKAAEAIAEGEEVCIQGNVSEICKNEYGVELVIDTGKFKYKVYLEDRLWQEKQVSYGNKVIIKGIKKNFSVSLNPGGFDERQYNYSLGIVLKLKGKSIEVTDERRNEFKVFTSGIKSRMTETLENICNERDKGVLMAMLYGEKEYLDSELKAVYAEGGISHILAISGLHISIIGAGLYSVLVGYIPGRWAGAISTIFMILYGIMAGGSVSAVRAIIMFLINLLSRLTGYIYDIKNAICVSAAILLIDNPYYIYNMGFKLSFGAVIAIGFVMPYVNKFIKTKGKILKSFIAGLIVNIVTGPIVANGFFQISFYGIFLNIIVIPMMGIVLLSGLWGIVAGSIFYEAGKVIILPGIMVLRLYEMLCNISAKLPFSRIITGHFDIMDLLIYYGIICVSILVIWRLINMEKGWDKTLRKPWRYIFSMVVTMVLHIYLYTANPEKKTITFLHVGQGDSSVFVSESGTVCLFDGGSTSIESPGKYIILPYLKYRGIACIDYIILSHSDEDHINGIGEIIEDKSLKVRNIILPTGDDGFGEIEAMAENNKINIIRADSEMGIEGNDFKIDFINPLKRYEGQYKDKNDNSLGAVIEMNGVKAAMTGDIGQTAEEWIMEGENLSNVDILKVPHHGSKHSSSEEFLECMQPKLAVISCGENNSYGHPHKETVDRLMKLGTVIYETYVRGAVTVRVYGEQMEIEVFCK